MVLCLLKGATRILATASETIGTLHQQHKGDPQQQVCRNSRDANNSTSIRKDANSTEWILTTPEFSRKLADKLSEHRKFVKKDIKTISEF
jgi:hypothetical protein